MTLLIFLIMLALTALFGGAVWALLSHVPGKRSGTLLIGLLLSLGAPALFLGILCLLAGSTDLRVVLDRFFLERLSKLLGCVLLLLLISVLGLAAAFLRSGGPRRYFRRVCGSRPQRLAGAALAAALFGMLIGCVPLAGDPPASPLRLSEICCSNFTLQADPDSGEFGDYIEILNTGEEPVDLAGYFLSDNGKKRNRFRLPAHSLGPGETVLLWADGSGKSGRQTGADIHLNFSIKPGDTLWFSSPNGVLLDRVTVPERRKNIALSLLDGEWVLARGTPGAGNETAVLYDAPTLAAPVLSLPSGFYDEPQTLELSAAPGQEIRYTLDGSLPTAESPLWTGPMTLTDVSEQPNRVLNHPTTTLDRTGVVTEPVDKGTLLRAAVFDAEGGFSEPVTAVYFVGARFAAYAGQAVLNITATPNDLFGNYGIAVTGRDYDRWLEAGGEGSSPWPIFYARGRVAERDALISLFDAEGRLLMEEPCGIRLQGDSTRTSVYKRFRLIARTLYSGSSRFSVPIFGTQQSHSFFTRQDTADIIAQLLCEGIDLGGLDAVPAAVFVNGEYYYDTYLRERYDRQYFEDRFGVDPDDLVIVSNDEPDKGSEADYEAYRALMDYIYASDCSDPAVYDEICRQIDVQSYARYIAVNLYCNNTDWSIYKNYKLWRSRSADGEGFLDGRWRWLVYDMDGCVWTRPAFGKAPRASYDIFSYPAPYTEEPFVEMPLFRDLLRNPDFRLLFTRTWLELMNLTLTPERAQAILDRFGVTDDSFWVRFLEDRPAYAADILIRELALSGQACKLRVSLSDPECGSLLVDGQSAALSAGDWNGTWITGVPLSLSVEPAAGWRFVGWQGAAGSAPELTLTPEGDLVLTAVFERK